MVTRSSGCPVARDLRAEIPGALERSPTSSLREAPSESLRRCSLGAIIQAHGSIVDVPAIRTTRCGRTRSGNQGRTGGDRAVLSASGSERAWRTTGRRESGRRRRGTAPDAHAHDSCAEASGGPSHEGLLGGAPQGRRQEGIAPHDRRPHWTPGVVGRCAHRTASVNLPSGQEGPPIRRSRPGSMCV